jgi:glutamine amidotransferase
VASAAPVVAIADYGLGNLFSVAQACAHAGLDGRITADPDALRRADAVLLPGVGAFGNAVAALERTGLGPAVTEAARAGTPLMGVCLGLQLLASTSSEFGAHHGLGLVDADVVRLEPVEPGAKVPQVGWNRIAPAGERDWVGTPLEGVEEGGFMYFVHSYHLVPAETGVALSETDYAGQRFCSSVLRENIFACQFHPERSGPAGLRVYENLRAFIART